VPLRLAVLWFFFACPQVLLAVDEMKLEGYAISIIVHHTNRMFAGVCACFRHNCTLKIQHFCIWFDGVKWSTMPFVVITYSHAGAR